MGIDMMFEMEEYREKGIRTFPPVEEGYYWVRHVDLINRCWEDWEVVYLYKDHDGCWIVFCATGNEEYHNPDEFPLWFGPLKHP